VSSTHTKNEFIRSCDRKRDLRGIRRGNIPRQLALEVLDSVHSVLFPADIESRNLLRDFVTSESLDRECMNYDSSDVRLESERDVKYEYFESRLMDLYDEIEHPRPRGYFERWLERRSGARHVMIWTVCGIASAVVLGFLALVVSVSQTVLVWEAWKHPASPS